MPKLEMSDREDYLSHEGILGMHWGERRYQNYDGSLTEEGRKRYGVGRPRMTKAEKLNIKKKKQQEKNLKKARDTKKKLAKQEQKAERDAQKLMEKKQKIYTRADPKEIYKNRELFTTEEYQKAVQRAELFNRSKPVKQQPVQTVAPKQAKVDDGKMHAFQLYTGQQSVSDRRKLAIINSGDPKLVRKNLSKLNDQELRSALEHVKGRAELDSKIPGTKDYKKLEKAAKDRKISMDGKSATEHILKGVGTVSSLFKTGTEAFNNYNTMAASINQIIGSDRLPVFQNTATNWKQFNEQQASNAAAARAAQLAENRKAVLTDRNKQKWTSTTTDPIGVSDVQSNWSNNEFRLSDASAAFSGAFGDGTFSTEISSIFSPDLFEYS